MPLADDIRSQLAEIASAPHFDEASQTLVELWQKAGVGFEAVRPVLEFMEHRPEIDFGSPGALVHFIERYWRKGYEAEVLRSVARQPTEHTVWLLNRLINGEEDLPTRVELMDAMRRVKADVAVDEVTRAAAIQFLGRLDK